MPSSDNQSPLPAQNPGAPLPAGTPSAPDRKGVLDFIQSLKSPPPLAPETPAPSQVAKPFAVGGPLYRHFAEFSWASRQNQWLKVSFIAHCALMLLIWGGAYLAFNRPTYLQVGDPSLSEAAREFYASDYTKVDPALIFDQMSYFTLSNLSLLHQVDAYSPSHLALLKGMIKPDIIDKAKRRFDRNIGTIQKQKFVQNLIINRVLSPIPNTKAGTVALFVEGFFSIVLQDPNGDPINRISPYRAKLILRLGPVSDLNPFPFFLEDLTEVTGAEEVKKWDEDNKKFFK